MKRLIALIALLVIVALGLSFAVLNAGPVPVNYYFGSLTLPLSFVITLALALGALLGVVASLGLMFAQRLEMSSLRKRINLCEREVRNLREIPFKDH